MLLYKIFVKLWNFFIHICQLLGYVNFILIILYHSFCKVQVFNANDSKRHRNVKMVLEILDIQVYNEANRFMLLYKIIVKLWNFLNTCRINLFASLYTCISKISRLELCPIVPPATSLEEQPITTILPSLSLATSQSSLQACFAWA